MDTKKIKSDLHQLAENVRHLTNNHVALSLAMRYADADTLGELFRVDEFGGMEEIVQTLRASLAGLDHALNMVGQEMVTQARELQRRQEDGGPR
jgi:hypothetical protein